jgi:t-SNARE complex subunit (syntaxin)
MVELAQLFQDLDQIVMQQEPLVENIEQKGEEIHSNVVQANTEIGGAIEKARSRNRKKWWCLLICGMFHLNYWAVNLMLMLIQSSSLSSSLLS